MRIRGRRKRIQKIEKAINTMNVRCEYLQKKKEECNLKTCSIEQAVKRNLECIEGYLRCIKAEISRIEKAEIEHEVILVKTDTGEYKLYDFMTGGMKRAPILSEDEAVEYINRRAGFKVY